MAKSDRARRRDNTGPKQSPSNKASRNQSNHKNAEGRRQDDTGTQQSEPNVTRQNRGSREDVGRQKDEQEKGNDQSL